MQRKMTVTSVTPQGTSAIVKAANVEDPTYSVSFWAEPATPYKIGDEISVLTTPFQQFGVAPTDPQQQ